MEAAALRSSAIWLAIISLLICLSEGMRLRGQPLPSQRAISDLEGRVAGGSQAKVGDWPFMVSIQNRFEYPFCNGVIIDDRWVLTAASCVSGLRANNLLLLTGTVSTSNITAPGNYVDQIHIHCNFDNPLYHNDIALLHVIWDFKYNDVTAKANIAEVDELEENEPLSFAAWGATTSGGSRSQNLQQAEGTYLPVNKCRTVLENDDDVDLGHVCVQMVAGKGTCHGDTGGPLVNAQGQLVGIGNWGVPCGRGYPDVYARVAFYNDWIRTIINGCGSA